MDEVYRQERNYLTTLMKPGLPSRRHRMVAIMLRVVVISGLKRVALEQEAAVQKQQLAEMRPKASYYDVVLNSPSLLAVSEFAKDYGWSAKRMNQYLHEKGVQYKQGGKIWLLYQKYAGCGYTSTKTHAYPAHDGTMHTKVHTYWTQKGRLFIYDLLKADGILPLIERGN